MKVDRIDMGMPNFLQNGALSGCACFRDEMGGSPNRPGWDSDPKRIFCASFGFNAVNIGFYGVRMFAYSKAGS